MIRADRARESGKNWHGGSGARIYHAMADMSGASCTGLTKEAIERASRRIRAASDGRAPVVEILIHARRAHGAAVLPRRASLAARGANSRRIPGDDSSSPLHFLRLFSFLSAKIPFSNIFTTAPVLISLPQTARAPRRHRTPADQYRTAPAPPPAARAAVALAR